jgi:hypothetical protein
MLPPLPAGPPSLPESPHYPGANEPPMNAPTVEGRPSRSGSLAMLAAMRRASTNSAGPLLIPVPISPPKMDGIDPFVRWGRRGSGVLPCVGDARPDRALGCVDGDARFARPRYSYRSHTMRALRAVTYLTNALPVRTYGVKASLPVSSSRSTMASSPFRRLGQLCRLMSLQAKRPYLSAISYLVVNHTVPSIPIK